MRDNDDFIARRNGVTIQQSDQTAVAMGVVKICTTLMLLLIPFAPPAPADEIRQHPLFKIERSKNANIVQYDARVAPDGKLDRKEPIVAYWLRLAEEGQAEELSWTQRTFAYGFSAKLNDDRTGVTLELKAKIGRPIQVRCTQSSCLATSTIDGATAYLRKIFVQSTGKGTSTRVDFIDLFGDDVNGGGERYERIVP